MLRQWFPRDGRKKVNKPRILLFDIEASSLNASFGITLCFGYKWLGEKTTKVISISDYSSYETDRVNDKPLLEDVAKILGQADMWVTWYGSKFDIPFLQTRMTHHKMSWLPNIPHTDLLFHSRSKFKMHSNRLAAVSEFMGWGSKTPVLGDHWVRAIAGYKESLMYVTKHCRKDVQVLEKGYLDMRAGIRGHVRVAGWNPCRVCGSNNLQRRGTVLTVTKGQKIRVRCSDCGAWETRSTEHASIAIN